MRESECGSRVSTGTRDSHYDYLNLLRLKCEVRDVQERVGSLQARPIWPQLVQVQLEHVHRERGHRLVHERALHMLTRGHMQSQTTGQFTLL